MDWREWRNWIYWHIWYKIINIPHEIIWFFQRGKRGFADCDAWDFKSYLAEMIPKVLKIMLKSPSWGYPDYLMTEKKWKRVYRDIITGFEIYAKHKCDEYDLTKKQKAKYEKAKKLFMKYFGHFWD